MTNGSRTMDPPFTGQFVFQVDEVDIGAFTEVSGLSVEVEVEEVAEGGQNGFVHKLPGRMKWPNIVMKRGVADADSLFEWFLKTSGEGFAGEGDKLTRTTGKVLMVDAAGRALRGWEFYGAYPVRWNGPTFAATSSDLAMEELEIAHHGFSGLRSS